MMFAQAISINCRTHRGHSWNIGSSVVKVSKFLCSAWGPGLLGAEFFQRWGQTDVAQAKRMIDLCLDAGISFFDTADVYSDGVSEILGEALKGQRQKVLISTNALAE
jgi:aryl-alcohol dehydrogenase-like predicted oxidoreductase